MSERICPKTQSSCTETLCNAANDILADAVVEVRKSVKDGTQFGKIIHSIGEEIRQYEDSLGVSLHPELNEVRTVVCPEPFIQDRRTMSFNDTFIGGYLRHIAENVVSGAVHNVEQWR
jgi:hypothetical protein